MSHSLVPGRRQAALAIAMGLALASVSGVAGAFEFEWADGWSGHWNTDLSVGASWRAKDPDPKLYTAGDGSLIGLGNGLAGQQTDLGNLNYAKNDRFSTVAKFVSDIDIKKGSFGALVRLRGWYDEALKDEKVRVGNQANLFNGGIPGFGPLPTGAFTALPQPWPQAKLSDATFERPQKFAALMLLDAYVYDTFRLGNTDLQARVGNQVLNWGESLFIQGINQINPVDVNANFNAFPGTQVKEILLPVWMTAFNWGLGGGKSLEAFYQFKWTNTAVPSCGTYWSGGFGDSSTSWQPGLCHNVTTITPPYAPFQGSEAFATANGLYVPLTQGLAAKNSGQFGLSFKFPVGESGTELGLYAMNIHSRTPILSGRMGGAAPAALAAAQGAGLAGVDALGPFWRIPGSTTTVRQPLPLHAGILGSFGIPVVPAATFFEYPEDIHIFGVSMGANLGGWSVSAELGFSPNTPAQRNTDDLVNAMLAYVGPMGMNAAVAAAGGPGTYLPGYDRFHKTQFQVSVQKQWFNLLRADVATFAGEVGAQWNNVPDGATALRYGRAAVFGFGSSAQLAAEVPVTQGSTCLARLPVAPGVTVPNPLFNAAPDGCTNDGFVTSSSWGYRLFGSLDYKNAFNSGITVTPSLFWAHDVKGVAIDGAFIDKHRELGLGLKFNYASRYSVTLTYITYGNAAFDALRDRDYYSLGAGVTF
jgi:hypothetical protein